MPDPVIPSAVEAYQLIEKDPSIEILAPLHPIPDSEAGAGEFLCNLPVAPQPNPEGLPPKARFRVRIAATFPFSPVEIFAEDDEFRGFPHQDAETGKLCLREESAAPWNTRRLAIYLQWAREWLEDAATRQLLRPGDRFELPDFSRRKLARAIPTDFPVFFNESPATFDAWKDRIGRSGRVEFLMARSARALLAHLFHEGNDVVLETSYVEGVFKPSDPKKNMYIFGRWMLLPDLRFVRQRPAQTFPELLDLCQDNGIDLGAEMKLAWEERNKSPWASIVLVGQPIPERVGDPPSEIHWQPFFFESVREDLNTFKLRFGKLKRKSLWMHVNADGRFTGSLPWGKSVNIARERMYARGHIPAAIQSRKIVLAGCGAIGSVVGELLARGGAESLSLFDGDNFEMGNQCRHTLDGTDVGDNKAEALARRLLSCNPLSKIKGFPDSLPLSPDAKHRLEGSLEAISESEILIDCTTDEGAFRWLTVQAKESKARVVSIFVNFGAEILTLCVSGRNTSCKKVCDTLYGEVLAGFTPVTRDQYDRRPATGELVIPGAGCWHPTFPARITHIWLLATTAVEMLLNILQRPLGPDGTAVLLRRNPSGTVEKIWEKQYR